MRFKEVSWKRGISTVKYIQFHSVFKVFGNSLAVSFAEAQGYINSELENMIGAWKFESKMA